MNPKLVVGVLSFLEMLPASYFWKEGISRTGGVVDHLSVALDGEVGYQSPSIHSTSY